MGELFREGASRPVRPDELALYREAQLWQAKHQVPVLQHAQNSREYLFFALFDGTGQNADDRRQPLTNVGVLREQVYTSGRRSDLRVGGHYVEGIGTQTNPVPRVLDGALAYTWDEKIERAYFALAKQAQKWKAHDPEAHISIVEVGYSRGAVLVPGFAQLVDKYGIADPEGLRLGRDKHGNMTVESNRPPLVSPGQTAQAVALFDPVATSMPRNYDARLPPSVISAFSLLAANEQREAFPHQTIADLQFAAERRILGAKVPGGHSNVGGGNRDAGLESMAFNLVADYLNGLRDQPLIEYRELPGDPSRYTVYQARGVTAIPGLDRDGERNLREELANCTIVDPCRDGEAMDRTLAGRFEYRPLQPSAPMPTFAPLAQQSPERQGSELSGRSQSPDAPGHPDRDLLEQIRRGVREIDRQAGKPFDEASERLSRSLLAASKGNLGQEPAGALSLDGHVLSRADHVVLGAEGRYAFVVEGGLRDPAHRYAMVEVAQAIRTPVEQSDLRLEAANRQIARESHREEQQLQGQAIEVARLTRAVPALP